MIVNILIPVLTAGKTFILGIYKWKKKGIYRAYYKVPVLFLRFYNGK